MSGEIGAAGDIATGMLVGRVAEPHAGEIAHRAHEHGLCLNCGTSLHGDFCHACGQAGHVHRSLHSIGHDLLHGVFHFEGKIWRTLPMLAFHPGALTRRYIAGERARFVSPLALFLFSVFLMFATIHAIAGELGIGMPPEARTRAVQNIDANIAKNTARLAELQATPNAPGAAEKIAELKDDMTSLTAARNVMSGKAMQDIPLSFDDVHTSWHALDKGLAKARENPGLVLYKLQSSAYKYSWALIPISTPFVALLFLWRRRFQMYDHAIFVTYSIAFMMMLVVTLTLLSTAGVSSWLIERAALIIPPVHMFAQLRGAYGLRKRSALWRTVALLIFAWVALLAFAAMLLVMGLME